MMVMVSASNSFATKSATSMKGYNTAVVDTTDTTKTEPVEDTTKTEPTGNYRACQGRRSRPLSSSSLTIL